MATITKEINNTTATIWAVEAARINRSNETVQISAYGYDNQANLNVGANISQETVVVPSAGYNGTEAWELNALVTAENSKFKDGVIEEDEVIEE